jgi:ATP/maltotriose-dependent transcriptional regulator MalT
MAGLGLADGDVAVLERRTEGWVAALQLAALSIRGHEDVGGFIARFAGNDRYIVDYLVDDQPDTVSLNHLRASEWYERNSLTDDAVRHAIRRWITGRRYRAPR